MPLDRFSVVLTQNQIRPVYHNVCFSTHFACFFALLKILKINEIGVCECTMVYFDVLKVYCVFWMLQFVGVILCANTRKVYE